MIIDIIQNVIEEHSNSTDEIKIWYIKEFLQSEVLDFIYRDRKYKNLTFYGWTAMRFLLWLNRLSEDLDFIWVGFNDFEWLGRDLKAFFAEQKNLEVDYKIQKFRVTLKFRNLLENFNLKFQNSRDLYLKIEISDHFDFCAEYKRKIYPVVYNNKSILMSSLDESTLFSTKLNAVLYRQRAKRNQNENISVKWRDFYDLFRYLQRKIQPNITCIQWIHDIETLKSRLLEIVTKTNFKEVILDIEPFVEDTNLLEFIENNGKEYILEQIEKW